MFQKIKTKFLSGLVSAKHAIRRPGRMKALAMMLMVSAVALAQNTAGDYTAGTTALGTVTSEIAKYVPVVVKLCYAIAGVVAVVGAISVYINIMWRCFRLYETAQICNSNPSKCTEIKRFVSMI